MPDRILIVEDEQITAEDLAEVLKGLGYDVTGVVASGSDAIREVEKSPPDLVLMDIRIKGDMDGTETARTLRERFDVPVVYLTAHADRDTLERAKPSRPMGYIVKPFHESELHASLEIALSKHRHDRKSLNRQQHVTDVFGALTLGIISVDHAEMIRMMNRTAENLTGWSSEEAIGTSLREVFRVAGLRTGEEGELPVLEALQQRSLMELQDRFLITKDGDRKAISGSHIAPLRGPDGRADGAVIMFEAVLAEPAATGVRPRVTHDNRGHSFEFGQFRIIAASEPMKQVLSFALRVAKSEATTVLLEGESGTGKDLMAQILHYASNRSGGPFVALNCAALPEALLESELFGREAGAYTDARTQKKGLLEVARGGTLFLDEVGDLTPAVQSKFLRVLEQQSFRRLGGVHEIKVDIRVIAATNRDLSDAVQSGAFRLDLFHRLSVIQIAPPPLREHPEDILPLAKHFIQEYNRKYKVNIAGLSPLAAKILKAYHFPGNVRELRNVIERAMLLEETNMLQPGSIQFASARAPRGIPDSVASLLRAAPTDFSLQNSERGLIIQALEKAGGNKTKAAALLGVSRDILRHRMKKLKLLE